MDHAHPIDLAFIISEMEFSGVIRKSDNILEIFESINLIVKGIYIISKKINQGMESLDPQAQEVKQKKIKDIL